MSKRDYYELLGVDRSAADQEIKKAYRRIAMKYHPDRNPDDEDADAKFKEATEAYDVLMNAEQRSAYDQFGHAGVDQAMGGGGFQGGASFSDIFGDVFGDIFGGGGGGRQGPQRGSDLRYTMEVSLEEAVRGATREIKVPTLQHCGTCDGSGAKPGTNPVTCGSCGGAGQVRMQQGFFQVQQTCPKCRGRGKTISDPCIDCRGQGLLEKTKTLSVKVPPGVDTGDRIRLSGEGEAGPSGGPNGDLFVQIAVRQHNLFERDGRHLYCEVPINFVDAALGGELEVPTLDGKVKLKIPSETQTGKMFRLRGKGVQPVRGGPVGDLMCRAVVETPVNLSAQQRQLLEEFRATLNEGGDSQSPRQSSWFEGVKSFFDGMTK